ncbi:transcription initiation factor TFIID subunit 11 isoform X1 [Cryptomeria japonica]|uniref:transcription initiation factor TFIID subunit 11 isoform X1 n=1 Tax=Cryptomeria japonica TaxID=3369 RepID=UPI0027DA0A59|nr:transcription initiation factor TFIID subunit 11 isoform X1 [Cryptomeria japonica]
MSLDPFESAFNESVTPPDSPLPSPTHSEAAAAVKQDLKDSSRNNKGNISSDDEDYDAPDGPPRPQEEHQQPPNPPDAAKATASAAKDEDDDDEENENVDVELGKYQSEDPDKTERFTAILKKFTPDQMERYESFRRAGFQKANMRRLLQNIAGCPVSMPMTIVMSGVAKVFMLYYLVYFTYMRRRVEETDIYLMAFNQC